MRGLLLGVAAGLVLSGCRMSEQRQNHRRSRQVVGRARSPEGDLISKVLSWDPAIAVRGNQAGL